MKELQAIVGHLLTSPNPSVLVTLASVEGSSYRRAGARMLVTPEGQRIGSISGGCLEEDLVERAGRAAQGGRAEVVVYDTSSENDLVWGVGLGCHGIVRILVEPVLPKPAWAVALGNNLRRGVPTELAVIWESPGGELGTRLGRDGTEEISRNGAGMFVDRIEPPPALAIFGGGDDAQPLARLALELGWRVTVADARPAMPTEARFPGVFSLRTGPPDALVAGVAPAPGSLAVVMTHHYRHDVPLMRGLLPLNLAYLGLLGPKKRAHKLLEELRQEGLAITPQMYERLRAPVGLDLGADAPGEVALSIVAEMTAVLARRDGRPLRERQLPIHA